MGWLCCMQWAACNLPVRLVDPLGQSLVGRHEVVAVLTVGPVQEEEVVRVAVVQPRVDVISDEICDGSVL